MMTSQHFVYPQLAQAAAAAYATYDDDEEDVWPGDSGGSDVSFQRDFLFKLASYTFASPFEVTKILMQVQYLAKRSLAEQEHVHSNKTKTTSSQRWRSRRTSPEAEDAYFGYDESEASDDSEDDGAEHGERRETQDDLDENLFRKDFLNPLDEMTDELGYVLPTEPERAEHELPPLVGGVYASMADIASSPMEGLFSLWKGFVPFYLYEFGRSRWSHWLEDVLNEQFDLYDPHVIPLEHQQTFTPNLLTQILSQVIPAVLLSPLEMVHVRLVAQSRQKPTYSSSLSALTQISRESPHVLQQHTWSSRFRALYPHLSLTVTYHFLRAAFRNTTQLVLQRAFRLSVHRHPFLFGCGLLSLFTVEFLLLSPLQTIRRRLQAQEQPPRLYYRCVSTSGIGYSGTWNCMYRMVSEESLFSYSRDTRIKEQGWMVQIAGGIAQLYRGFWYQSLANVMTSILGVVAVWGVDERDPYYF